jgi:hypothetical protein
MSLEFLRDTPETAFRQTISDLQSINPKFHPGVFETMSIEQIDMLLDNLTRRERRIIDESPYGAWISDPLFIQIKMLQDGLVNLREHIENLEEIETLVPGFTYYTDVRQFGDRVEGKTCTYLGEGRPSHWINFVDSAPIMKALEVMRHGDIADFRRIYVEMANGRPDGLENVSIEHITESTDAALREMEAYCDARWDGPWPWEIKAPYKINRIIEEYKQMRQQTLYEMHETLANMLREFDQGGQEQFEITSMVRNMSDTVQKMIEQFAKLAGDAMINLRAAVMTQQGDEGAMKVEHGLTNAVNQAADALARLKVELDNLVDQLNVPPDMGGLGNGGMGGDMGGGPGGDMGGAPGGDMGADMGGGMGAAGGAPDMGAGGPGMPANDNMPQGGPAANAAPGGMPPAGAMEPERPRKKA